MTVYFSGCRHNCVGCHNPLSHDFGNGRPFTTHLQDEIIQYVNDTPYITGVTLSGGDPMFSAGAVTPFARRLRDACSGIDIWIYSGFTYEQIIADPQRSELLSLCDVLVDGKFELALKSPNLKYKGSKNQRTIDVQASLSTGQIVLVSEE